MEGRTKYITATVTPSVKRALERLAKTAGLSQSSYLRRLIRREAQIRETFVPLPSAPIPAAEFLVPFLRQVRDTLDAAITARKEETAEDPNIPLGDMP